MMIMTGYTEKNLLTEKLQSAGYKYNALINQFT